MTSRRAVLGGLAALALPRPIWADVGRPAYVAAAQERDGSYSLSGLTAEGNRVFAVALPARGHAAASHPVRAEAIAFARRPGVFALVIDCASGAVLARLTPPEGRQFNGHGCFSADGARLYTSEVMADGSAGRIGVWDTATYARAGEFASGGIGPHDLKRLADGRLVIANGGIATDPDDRSKLNIDSMHPNLTLLAEDGTILDQTDLEPALWQNSIRHLALAPDDTIAFAMQWEGDPAEAVPLLGLWQPGSAPVLCPPPEAEGMAMKGYAASIAFDGAGALVALTSPRGGRVHVFRRDGSLHGSIARADVSGIAAGPDGFVLTDGNGVVSALQGGALRALTNAPLAWDNHLIALV